MEVTGKNRLSRFITFALILLLLTNFIACRHHDRRIRERNSQRTERKYDNSSGRNGYKEIRISRSTHLNDLLKVRNEIKKNRKNNDTAFWFGKASQLAIIYDSLGNHMDEFNQKELNKIGDYTGEIVGYYVNYASRMIINSPDYQRLMMFIEMGERMEKSFLRTIE